MQSILLPLSVVTRLLSLASFQTFVFVYNHTTAPHHDDT